MYVYTLSSESSLQLNWQSCSLNSCPWDPCFVYKSLENFSTKECFWGILKMEKFTSLTACCQQGETAHDREST